MANRQILVALSAVALTLTAACGGSSDDGSGGPSGGKVVIGVLASESGELGLYGVPFIDGAKMAVDKINKAGGFEVDGSKYEFDLKVVDDRSEEAGAVQGATELINDSKAKAIIGPLGALGPAVTKIASARDVLNFSSSSSVAAIAGPPDNPLNFLTNGSSAGRVQAMFDAADEFLSDVDSIALVGAEDETAAGLVPLFKKLAADKGVKLNTYIYPDDATDLSTTLTRVASSDPDVIFMGWNVDDQTLQGGQFDAAGIGKDVAMSLFSGTISGCETLAKGRPCMAHPLAGADLTSPDLDDNRKKFVSDFEAFTGDKLPAQTAPILWTYDFPNVMAAAMTEAGTVTDTDKIAAALKSVKYAGVLGDITFDDDNNAVFGYDITFIAPDGTVRTANFG